MKKMLALMSTAALLFGIATMSMAQDKMGKMSDTKAGDKGKMASKTGTKSTTKTGSKMGKMGTKSTTKTGSKMGKMGTKSTTKTGSKMGKMSDTKAGDKGKM